MYQKVIQYRPQVNNSQYIRSAAWRYYLTSVQCQTSRDLRGRGQKWKRSEKYWNIFLSGVGGRMTWWLVLDATDSLIMWRWYCHHLQEIKLWALFGLDWKVTVCIGHRGSWAKEEVYQRVWWYRSYDTYKLVECQDTSITTNTRLNRSTVQCRQSMPHSELSQCSWH